MVPALTDDGPLDIANESRGRLYQISCAQHGVHPNSEILQWFKDPTNMLDLRNNYCGGDFGLKSLLKAIEGMAEITHFDLSSCRISPDAFKEVCAVASRLPNLCCLNVANNSLYLEAGQALLHCVRMNHQIVEVITTEGQDDRRNQLCPRVEASIRRQCQLNNVH